MSNTPRVKPIETSDWLKMEAENGRYSRENGHVEPNTQWVSGQAMYQSADGEVKAFTDADTTLPADSILVFPIFNGQTNSDPQGEDIAIVVRQARIAFSRVTFPQVYFDDPAGFGAAFLAQLAVQGILRARELEGVGFGLIQGAPLFPVNQTLDQTPYTGEFASLLNASIYDHTITYTGGKVVVSGSTEENGWVGRALAPVGKRYTIVVPAAIQTDHNITAYVGTATNLVTIATDTVADTAPLMLSITGDGEVMGILAYSGTTTPAIGDGTLEPNSSVVIDITSGISLTVTATQSDGEVNTVVFPFTTVGAASIATGTPNFVLVSVAAVNHPNIGFDVEDLV